MGTFSFGANRAAKTKSESKSEVVVSSKNKNNPQRTYYHVTTMENAQAIMASGIMQGSSWEGGYVFAWLTMPNQYAMGNSGAHLGVVISFETSVPFVIDLGISDPKIIKFGPVMSAIPGPIQVYNVTIVRGNTDEN